MASGWDRRSHPERVQALGRSEADSDAPVAFIDLRLGDDGALIRAAVEPGYKGLVVQGMGGGHMSVSCADEVERAAHNLPVILASRTGTGEVLRATYGFPGSEIDLQRRGAIRAGWVDGIKARVLHSLALC